MFPKFCPKPAQVDCEISSQLLTTRSSAELDMDMQCEIFFRLKRTCFALQSGQPNIPNSCTAKKNEEARCCPHIIETWVAWVINPSPLPEEQALPRLPSWSRARHNTVQNAGHFLFFQGFGVTLGR